jgi:hypothetical protein
MNIQDLSSTALLKRRHRLARGLPPIEQILRGSLSETYKRCGRPNCHCADGPGHGPKRYLSTISRTGERPRVGYVPNAAHTEVREFLVQGGGKRRAAGTRQSCGGCSRLPSFVISFLHQT